MASNALLELQFKVNNLESQVLRLDKQDVAQLQLLGKTVDEITAFANNLNQVIDILKDIIETLPASQKKEIDKRHAKSR